jgi:hypothetical protein
MQRTKREKERKIQKKNTTGNAQVGWRAGGNITPYWIAVGHTTDEKDNSDTPTD